MTTDASSLYNGAVTHQRLRPRRHRLRYRIFSLLLDLDTIDEVSARLRLFSHNRFNLFGFYDRDYGEGSVEPLRAQIERHLRQAGLEADGGPIRLLTMPRVLGYVFNPLTIYFCYRRSGALSAVLYEVTNTFHERHSYLIPVGAAAEGRGARPIRQECSKQLYVSPFLDMDMTYSFRIAPPGERLSVAVTGSDGDAPIIVATLVAKRVPLTDWRLALAFVTYPLLTLKVVAGIHWEALRIWRKGVGVRSHPQPPAGTVTLGRPIEPEDSGRHVA